MCHNLFYHAFGKYPRAHQRHTHTYTYSADAPSNYAALTLSHRLFEWLHLQTIGPRSLFYNLKNGEREKLWLYLVFGPNSNYNLK
jgi:hypothetical protein